MSLEAWAVFALFWVVFVTTPGPNAVNCITNGMTHGFTRSLWGVLGILTQATLFLTLSALGVTALIAASPQAFGIAKLAGAAVLIWLGLRGWINAAKPAPVVAPHAGSIYTRAFMIATVNPKSVAGYLAAFSQFVQPDVPIWTQMWVIFPTALLITAGSYCTYTALGAALGRAALGAVFNVWLRRGMALCFILYGVLLGVSAPPAAPSGA
ncbi:MAG: LysE family translocator [Paracoccaceae bacterium]|jgi:threonine/homoserine/homoserine lactone efflux protein|uniref:LysE family translocator n=1 Tax=unclassified Seohaeicola TaxID=2641111 RepID=UPI00237A54B0|nr:MULTISPECIES: LysE family translocator [unclassified Seohaeicola]MDD9706638.1 LysE family translocator [Seohaeicola sp. 4SK31]MDD9734344.1 LysE family translocator [Seohaeicola sp. SP36]MDM7968308.1 LysE family translocator [Paracoccaceae bacterium]